MSEVSVSENNASKQGMVILSSKDCSDSLSDHLKKWQDLCAGIALLYAGPVGKFDDLTDRLRVAMESNDMEEMSHFCHYTKLDDWPRPGCQQGE